MIEYKDIVPDIFIKPLSNRIKCYSNNKSPGSCNCRMFIPTTQVYIIKEFIYRADGAKIGARIVDSNFVRHVVEISVLVNSFSKIV